MTTERGRAGRRARGRARGARSGAEGRPLGSEADVIEDRESAPSPEAFAALFATTGRDPEGRMDAAAEALRPSWFDLSACDDGSLVGMGRIGQTARALTRR